MKEFFAWHDGTLYLSWWALGFIVALLVVLAFWNDNLETKHTEIYRDETKAQK